MTALHPEDAPRTGGEKLNQAQQRKLAGVVEPLQRQPQRRLQPNNAEGRGLKVVTAFIGQSMTVPMASGRGGPLDDPRVRLAIHHSVDADAIIRSLWAGRARKLEGQIVGPDGFGYNPQVKAIPYDVGRAKQLLTEAGYPNGLEVQFDLPPNYYEKDTEMFNVIQAQAAQAGIRIKANAIDRGRRLDRLYGGTLGPLFFIAWQYLPAMDAELPLSLLHSSSQMKLLNNKKFDELLDQSRGTVDQEQRLRILQEIMVLLRNDPPMIYLYQVPASFGLSPSVENFRPAGDWGFDFLAVTRRR